MKTRIPSVKNRSLMRGREPSYKTKGHCVSNSRRVDKCRYFMRPALIANEFFSFRFAYKEAN